MKSTKQIISLSTNFIFTNSISFHFHVNYNKYSNKSFIERCRYYSII